MTHADSAVRKAFLAFLDWYLILLDVSYLLLRFPGFLLSSCSEQSSNIVYRNLQPLSTPS